MLIRSARTRLVIASAFLGIISITLVLGLVYWTANRIIEAETRSVVDAEISGLADSYSSLGMSGLARAINRRIDSTTEPDALYLLTDRFGNPIAGNLAAWPTSVAPGGGWVEIELIRTDINRTVPISAASIQLRGGERLLVGRDASARQRFDRVLGQSLALALAIAIALSLMIGWLLTRLGFRRVGEISETAREIVSGDLTRRMPARADGDEFDQVALTLNEMLDRIEALVANLRMTTNSLSHDLRSPLTRLRGQVELMMDDAELSTAERTAVGENALREVDHILRVFADLTEIARAEAGIGRSEFRALDLAALTRDVAEFYQPVAMEQDISIRVAGHEVEVPGHRALLNRAVSNLLENAIRHAPPGSEIFVQTRQSGSRAIVSVADRGAGVPLADRDRILDPFVTLDPSRTNGTTGLGLTLVASISRLHGGEVSIADNAPGLEVSMDIPRRPANASSSHQARPTVP
jgi:signal transduction histidine kinase